MFNFYVYACYRLLCSVVFTMFAVSGCIWFWMVLLHAPAGLLSDCLLLPTQQNEGALQHWSETHTYTHTHSGINNRRNIILNNIRKASCILSDPLSLSGLHRWRLLHCALLLPLCLVPDVSRIKDSWLGRIFGLFFRTFVSIFGLLFFDLWIFQYSKFRKV